MNYDGGGFEEWLRVSICGPISNQTWSELLALLEPYRDIVDDHCAIYDPTKQNWLAYRDTLWHGIPDDVRERVNQVLTEAMLADEREN